MRKVRKVFKARSPHWVGDGFYVNSVFHHMSDEFKTDPFLMMDYAAPQYYAPNQAAPLGVGSHPHKGFETVTFAYSGEVEHKDSSGAGGVIKPGDVQWMTAGAGVIHQEFHSHEFSKRGGMFEMVQLWVNLPAKFKNVAPKYQHLSGSDMPTIELENGAGTVRVIAGEFMGKNGIASTHTELNVIDGTLKDGGKLRFSTPSGHTLSIVVLRGGSLEINGGEAKASDAELVSFEKEDDEVSIKASGDVKFMILSGKPFDEPVVGYGPFVMNSKEEIEQAIDEFNKGEFGKIK